VSSSSSVTFSGLSGVSVYAGGGVPSTSASFTISPLLIAACVTSYVAVAVVDSPGSNLSISNVISPPNIGSFNVTSVNVVLPVFLISNVYATSSPTSVTLSLSAVFVNEIDGSNSPGTAASSSSLTGVSSNGFIRPPN